MKTIFKHTGFSLAEVLMAVGILSIGLMLIATMFPAALYLTTVASERTMAAVVADEAFAKIKLFGLNSYPPGINDYNNYTIMNSNEFSYPSVDPAANNSQYYWSALCKKLNNVATDTQYLVTVFVARKTSPAHTYQGVGDGGGRPKVINVQVQAGSSSDKLQITNAGQEKNINPPTAVLDNATCKIYHIIDRQGAIVTLDRPWEDALPGSIWLIPPPVSGGKNADIEVYQEIIKF
jgi:prepilin-type N-terminal cleavage/methylation domain-containing protein